MRAGTPTNPFGRLTLWLSLRRAFVVFLTACLIVGDPVAVLAFGRTPIPEHEEGANTSSPRGHLIEDRAGRERPFDPSEQPAGQDAPFPRAQSSRRPALSWQLVHTSLVQPGSNGAGAFLRC